MRKSWSEAEVKTLRQQFPSSATSTVAALLGRSESSVITKAYEQGIVKTVEYRKAYLAVNRVEAAKACIGTPSWNSKGPVTLQCKWCKQAFQTVYARRNKALFCTRACVTAWRKTIVGEAHWLYTLEARTCKWCKKEFKAKPAKIRMGEANFCSRQCQGASVSFTLSQQNGPTSIERKMHAYLCAKNIAFVPQYRIGPWCVDVFVPSLNLVIECDGDYWHSLPAVQIRDKRKNGYLKKHGYNILRLSETDINHDINLAVGDHLLSAA